MGEKSNSDLSLNPPPTRRRPSGSRFCLLILCISLAFLTTILVTCWPYFKDVRSPYAWLYQNTTLDRVLDRSKVVQPLIDEQQTFDIVFSVWQRIGQIPKDGNVPPYETLLHSGLAFSNVTLKDRGKSKKIKFRVPTYIFKYQPLTNFDLRATFSLVPTLPSLLEKAVETTSWIPESINLPPVNRRKSASTLSDEIIDQYSTQVPLVEFHDFDSYCESQTRPSEDDGVVTDDGSHGAFVYHTNQDSRNTESHPYIVTRSHIRVVDFTEVLNLEEFNQTHQEFRTLSCGQNTPENTASWYRCNREDDDFAGTGFWKTSLIKLGVSDENGVNHTEWAYSPYISAIRYPRGPLDLMPVPLCKNDNYVDVVWTVSYSGDNPFRTYLGDKIGSIKGVFDMTDSLDRLHLDQLGVEYIHGLAYDGQPYHEGHHELTLMILDNLSHIAEMADPILRLLYWYTRISIVGISLSGLLLLAISDIIHMILHTMYLADIPKGDFIGYIAEAFVVMGPVWIAVSFYNLKLAFRLGICWKGVIPQLKRVRATHAERANSRMDSRLPWWIKALFIISFSLIFYHFQIVPLVDYDSLSVTTVLRLLVYALFYTADISQIALNYHRGTFASMFKTASYLSVGNLAVFTFANQYLRGNEMDPINLFPMFLRVVMAIQAFRYPYAKDNLEDDE